ncbi:MAG: hypothetical protein HKM06_09410, partial [Spirochaetales bacterium]|nr:hypothetical protein [Spirochaetales bacterium]
WEGREILWLTDGQLSVPVDVKGADFWFLQTPDDDSWNGEHVFQRPDAPDEPPRRVFWKDLRALPEGVPFWVAGNLSAGPDGRVCFRNAETHLLLVAYEGRPETVVARTLWSSRQKIEHWNFITPLSLAVGLMALLIAGYFSLRQPGGRAEGLIALALALVPSTFFLPPGIAFFYAFNKLWTESRHQRGLRDLAFLKNPLDHAARLQYRKKARRGELLAQVLFLIGAGTNAALLLILLKIWIH